METDHKPANNGIPTWAMWVLGACAFAAAGFICLVGYWMIDRDPPLLAVSGRFVGWDNKVPRRGHVVWGGIPVRSDCEGVIYRFIVDGELVRLEPRKWEYRGQMHSEEKIPVTWDADFDVPPHIIHDSKYRNRFEFVCNPVHKFWPIPINPPDVPFYLREEDKVLPYDPGDQRPPSVRITPWE